MNESSIISKMNTYLHSATTVLVKWLGAVLPKTSEDWWEDLVISNLSVNQQETAEAKHFTKLEDFDLAALLRIANKSWYSISTVSNLQRSERDCIRDMLQVRNNWAHCGSSLPGKDSIVKDLETLSLFFEQRSNDTDLIKQVKEFTNDVKSASFSTLNASNSGSDKTVSGLKEEQNNIKEKDVVCLIGAPDLKGVVLAVHNDEVPKSYDVFVSGEVRTYYENQIVLFNNESLRNWVDVDTFRSYLTACQINNPNVRDLYSLNAARIDFVPYQFRPALKIIHSDEPRILIADSVGVGKTIEAGIILKELQARTELDRVVIICPKPLVTERKWELEMKRFDEDFVPLDGAGLRQVISDTDRDGEWPSRYGKIIIPYSILDSKTYEGEKNKKKRSFGLKDLDPAPFFDLVIVDEAHRIRNGSMEKEKAYDYKCVKYFCDHAKAVVMLTATPIQTSNDDLYTLLNVLRPDIVIDKDTFRTIGGPNKYLSLCSSIMRKANKGWKEKALNALAEVSKTQWGENVTSLNPVYKSLIDKLKQEKVTREERVKLISDVESLHSFNFMLNRTRRRDIQNFCIRKPYTLEVDFTAEQQELYNELLQFEQIALVKLHGDPRLISFMTSTIKRQAASCIFGLAPHFRDLINRRFQQLEEGTELEVPKSLSFEMDVLEDLASKLLEMAENLPEEDPKFDKMLIKIKEKQALENNKIIIFSTFIHTLEYLKKKLLAAGLRVAQIDGSTKDEDRQILREKFELSKDNEEAIDIMLFSEVGSEGLDYQFCDTIINYDLPWNPMKIEQRIGRIDRRGQLSENVNILNMITNGTVDADIYFRCLKRIGVFENSIGECEEILGEIATKIDQIAVDSTLTEKQRREKLEQMADNEVRKVQALTSLEEKEKDFFGFNISEYITSQEIQKAENPWLSQKSLQALIEQYLASKLGDGKYIVGEGSIRQLRLSEANRRILREDLNKLQLKRNSVFLHWDYYLKGIEPYHQITFDSDSAEKERNAFFITPMHPLVKQAANYYKETQNAFVSLKYASDDLSKGKIAFSVYAWDYVGMNPHSKIRILCDNDQIEKELPYILQEAESGSPLTEDASKNWKELKNKNGENWKNEIEQERLEAKNTARYKKESLSNNFNNRKRSLEQKIRDARSENIVRMYSAELESAQQDYDNKMNEIDLKVSRTDIYTRLIANGILFVL